MRQRVILGDQRLQGVAKRRRVAKTLVRAREEMKTRATTSISRKANWIKRGCLISGALTYVISFFLPAVDTEIRGTLPGWMCACASLLLFPAMFYEPDGLLTLNSLLALSGLINPLLLVYLGLLPNSSRVAYRIRPAAAMVAITLIPVTWIAFAISKEGIEIGHVPWVAGLVLLMGPEIFWHFTTSTPSKLEV